MSHARPRPVVVALIGLVIAALIAGCGSGGGSNLPSNAVPSTGCGAAAPDPLASAACSSGPIATPDGSSPTVGPSVAPSKLVVGLGYIPSVQFAQFYLAEQRGYYREAGLTIEFQNKVDLDLIPLIGQGAVDVGLGDGTSVIPAASNGIPVEYIATIYGKFPNVVFAKASSGITRAADLKGRKVGTPGRYGSGWIMLEALLGSAGLTTDDVQIVEYPDYTQRAAVEQGAVDAATGFANNEPVQMQLAGSKPVVLTIDAITPLPGPGLVSATKTLDAKHDAIAAFVAATLHAMTDIKADPTLGLDAAIKAVPELASQRAAQAAILAATVATWSGPVQDARGLGAIDRDGWTTSIAFLGKLNLLKGDVTTDKIVREDLLPAGD